MKKTNGWTDEYIANFLASEFDRHKLERKASALRSLTFLGPQEWKAFVAGIHAMLERSGPPLPPLEVSRAMIRAGLVSFQDENRKNLSDEDIVEEIFKEMYEARPKEYK